MLVWSPNFIHVAGATTDSSVNPPVDITALMPNIQGYTQESGTENNYNSYIAELVSAGYKNAKDYLPTNIPLEHFFAVQYENPDRIPIAVEIYEYENGTAAKTVYNSQTSTGYLQPFFQRFNNAPEVLLLRSQFMVFIICNYSTNSEYDPSTDSILSDFTQKFVDNLFNVIPESTLPPSPPSVTAPVIWGVQPGDAISWWSNTSGFTGYVGGGMGKTGGSSEDTIEIAQITDDKSAILLKTSKNLPSDFVYYSMFISTPSGRGVPLNLILPNYEYSWATDQVKEGPWTLIYPVYSNGNTLGDIIKSQGYVVTETAGSINGHYQTAPGVGYTPVETRWGDVNVNTATGITTGASFYYNNNDNHILSTGSLALASINFDLNSRVPISTTGTSSVTTNEQSSVSTTKTYPVLPSSVPTSKPPSPSPQPLPPSPVWGWLIILIVMGAIAYFIIRIKKL